MALHTLVFTLANVAYRELLDAAFPGLEEKPIADPYEAGLFAASEPAPAAYFAAQTSAPLHPKAAEAYRQMLAAALEHAEEEITAARLVYRQKGDLDILLPTALAHVSTVLTHAARLIGHCDRLDEPALKGAQALTALLIKDDLSDWFEHYARDLRRLYERHGRWSSLDEFMVLNRHAERLLWQHAIFPWRQSGGAMRVEVRNPALSGSKS